jgi:hypothetical protein
MRRIFLGIPLILAALLVVGLLAFAAGIPGGHTVGMVPVQFSP